MLDSIGQKGSIPLNYKRIDTHLFQFWDSQMGLKRIKSTIINHIGYNIRRVPQLFRVLLPYIYQQVPFAIFSKLLYLDFFSIFSPIDAVLLPLSYTRLIVGIHLNVIFGNHTIHTKLYVVIVIVSEASSISKS